MAALAVEVDVLVVVSMVAVVAVAELECTTDPFVHSHVYMQD